MNKLERLIKEASKFTEASVVSAIVTRGDEQAIIDNDSTHAIEKKAYIYKGTRIITYGVMQAPGSKVNNFRFAMGLTPNIGMRTAYRAIPQTGEPIINIPTFRTRDQALKVAMKDIDKMGLHEAEEPSKGDKVVSPYKGRKLKSGGTAPEHGIIKKISRGYAYVDFGVSNSFEPVKIDDLKSTGRGIWK